MPKESKCTDHPKTRYVFGLTGVEGSWMKRLGISQRLVKRTEISVF